MRLNDFLKSAAIGSGLRRAKTLAQGDDICDFRYKKGRPVVQNWDAEIDLIRSRSRTWPCLPVAGGQAAARDACWNAARQ